jgi:acetylglutamate kinase
VTLLVKLGGNAIDGDGLRAVARDLAELARGGEQIVVVHGGGPQTSALQHKLGQTPRKVAGRRITDEAALDAIKMVVAGKLNIDTCAALNAQGARPIGLHGASGLAVEARRRPAMAMRGGPAEPVDLGLVGDVVAVNRSLIEALCALGYLPVIACVGASRDGAVYNINADVVANRVAVELGAKALVLVSDTRGVLRDVRDAQSRIARLSERDALRAIDEGIISEGMIPKIEEAFAAIKAGVGRVHIVGCLGQGDLARELADPGSVGTVLVRQS